MKWLLKIPPHLAYVATLPCENIWYQKLSCSRNDWNIRHSRIKLPRMIQPFKLSLKKYCLEMWALISWQKCIFAVFVLHNSQNDQLYASASSTSQELPLLTIINVQLVAGGTTHTQEGQEGRKGIRPVKNWVVGCWRGYLEQGADLHMAQLMPLPLTVSWFSKIQTGFTFLTKGR